MDATEIAAFLDERDTGVLSLADGDDAYAIPVSFAADDGDLYFRLGYAPGSQKRRFVDATDHATFVTYEPTAEGWKSVVAGGRLETLSADSLDTVVQESVRDLDVPYYQVQDRPVDELDQRIVRLDVDRLSGIVGARPPGRA